MPTNDQKIQKLLKTIQTKKQQLGTKKRKPLQTNGIYTYPNNPNQYININTITNTQEITHAYAALIQYHNSIQEAQKRLKLPQTETQWSSYTIQQWEHDFKYRIDHIQHDNKKKELKQLENQLQNLISTEGKTKQQINQIEQQLK